MKVGELIDKLNEFDPDLRVCYWCEDDDLTALFDIVEISKTKAEFSRDENTQKPLVSFQGGDNSESAVIIEITTDF